MRSEKDTEADILWILDMHYVMLKYSDACWITSTRTPLCRDVTKNLISQVIINYRQVAG